MTNIHIVLIIVACIIAVVLMIWRTQVKDRSELWYIYKAVDDFKNKIVKNQKPLDEDIREIVDKHFWEMF